MNGRGALHWLLPAAALLLAGCASMAPPYERPPPAVAPQFPTATPDTAGPAAADLEWRQVFTDPRQQRLIELALQNNRDLRIAALNVEQAQARWQIQHASLWPTVSAGIGGNRQALPNGNTATTYSAGLLVTAYELDFFGRLRSLSESAQAQAVSAEEGRRATQIALVASVAAVHLSLLADDELLKLTQQTLETRIESLRLTQLRFDNGAASELDYRQSESLLEGARAALALTLRQRALDENALALLVGQALPADLPTPLPLDEGQLAIDVPAGLPSELLIRRPDIRAAEQQLIAANANIGAARAAFFPRISLTANFGTASTELSGLFNSGSWAFTGTAQLLQPIFDAGRNRANLELAEADRAVAVANYEKAIQGAFREVADALAGRATFGEQVRALAAQTNALAITYRLADLRYRAGAAAYLEALEAQRQLFISQQALVQSRALQLQNAVTLYRVLGGGWKDEPPPS